MGAGFNAISHLLVAPANQIDLFQDTRTQMKKQNQCSSSDLRHRVVQRRNPNRWEVVCEIS